MDCAFAVLPVSPVSVPFNAYIFFLFFFRPLSTVSLLPRPRAGVRARVEIADCDTRNAADHPHSCRATVSFALVIPPRFCLHIRLTRRFYCRFAATRALILNSAPFETVFRCFREFIDLFVWLLKRWDAYVQYAFYKKLKLLCARYK